MRLPSATDLPAILHVHFRSPAAGYTRATVRGLAVGVRLSAPPVDACVVAAWESAYVWACLWGSAAEAESLLACPSPLLLQSQLECAWL